MAGKVYMVPVTGYVLVEARNSSDADAAAQARLSDMPHIVTGFESEITPIDYSTACKFQLTEDYAIDHCGMTVGEFLAEQED